MFNSAESADRSFGWLIVVILGLFTLAVFSVSEHPHVNSSSSYYEKCAEQALSQTVMQDGAAGDQRAQASQQRQNQAPDWCDLAAQQSMAESTFAAARAAWWAALLTGLGILLIGFTLYFTKRTLDETRRGVDETQRIGEAQVRAYVRITSGSVRLVQASPDMTDQRIRPFVTINVKNYGQSPAVRFRWSVIARYTPPFHSPFLGSQILSGESWGKDIGCDETPSFSKNLGSAPLEQGAMNTLSSGELHVELVIRFAFTDVFDKQIEDERVFVASIPPKAVGIEVPLAPHVFDRETIESLIAVNQAQDTAQ